MRHVIPISGKDSLCTAIVQSEIDSTMDYEYVFNPTGIELPPVHDWLGKVGEYLESPIRYIGKNLDDIVQEQGILPSVRVRFCTRMAKIEPLEEYLAGSQSAVYYGLRADEPERIGYQRRNSRAAIYPKYPLRDLGINLPMVWKIVSDRDLLPPFLEWSIVTALVKKRMGRDYKIVDSLHPWERRILFSWRSREFNCAYCFFMRQYEFIGLHDHYPDIFWHACEIEESTGAEDYTLRQGYTLRSLLDRADEIRNRRAREITQTLYRKMQQPLFPDLKLGDDLSLTSCGMFCGK